MIYKIFYQPSQKISPRRENTLALYLEADSEVAARSSVEQNTSYNVEYIEELSPKALEYAQQNPNYQLTEFSK
ncbi:DNA-directed RNA polymerase subunit epsilon [Liquorilactobacillus satsumensis]|uniref:DNA-directed RNA polymerase subunit epsilon n=1 Tax=Liquorilactobacillus satsumensis DSM 16230 = JCM 12392 TaxID=1423801 RepID=A0A0R1V428_9LACO|nr:DNA-directed RNA polymerase subunit epsilon [Liquorilactobacillus satsumensis]KRL99940.1 hypothetical protein FD50_GL002477 [Liquorilactobacillus satsumensis DSM 16230 = JCM 12392]MCC7665568.1 DUF1447 domain-containing protein [Liquorilactobacillus satsumensis]MCP9311780.1 DNA-dependent RNA polymerase auxiliary subunit epsilon family protein [Liquorilactobacillus satsumensis]MCP9328420.1 DNA-dependent RNA polymerase auxiliary subunit epsilon family protein [Liquorilactobacillus satsumensis]